MAPGGKAYRAMRWILKTFSHKMTCHWEVPFDGEPCVFVPNHAGAFGPIDMVAKFPYYEDCCPWFNADVMDPKKVPAYVRQDYWWKPGCWAEPLLNVTLPYMAAAVLPPILRQVPGIPVHHDMRVMTTMRQSLRALKENKYLVIFPEQPSGWQSHHMWINTGFLQIAPMYHKATGKALKFWPVHIDYKKHEFRVAAPIAFDPERTLADQAAEIEKVLAYGLRGEPVPQK